MASGLGAKRKTNKYLWPLLLALGITALLFWFFNRGTDEQLGERLDAQPAAQAPNNPGEPSPGSQPVSTYIPNNENGNASVITEVDAARQATGAQGTANDGAPGAATAPPPTGANSPAMGSDGQTPITGSQAR
jgi:hypothetical protein